MTDFFVIRSNDEHAGSEQPEDGQLFWNDDDGWVHLSTATVYTGKVAATMDLPMGDQHEPTLVMLPKLPN